MKYTENGSFLKELFLENSNVNWVEGTFHSWGECVFPKEFTVKVNRKLENDILSEEYVFTNIIPEKADHKEQYITDATIGKAVRASSTFPAVFSPCKDREHAFMDGGTLDNIPVNEVKKQLIKQLLF